MNIYRGAGHRHWDEDFFLVCTEQWDDTAQKFDCNSFISATITISSGANPARVAQRCIAKDIRGLGSQSELAFNAIRCFKYTTNY